MESIDLIYILILNNNISIKELMKDKNEIKMR